MDYRVLAEEGFLLVYLHFSWKRTKEMLLSEKKKTFAKHLEKNKLEMSMKEEKKEIFTTASGRRPDPY